MGENSLMFMILHDLLNDVIKISCYEELISEINRMKGKSIADIVAKLTLIVITKKISDYGKNELYRLILTIQGLSKEELELYVISRTQTIENQKRKIEAEIEALLDLMELSGDERFELCVMYARYFEELGKSKYEFMKVINLMAANIDDEIKNGQVVNVDVDTIFNALKNSNIINKRISEVMEQPLGDSFPGTGGRH